MGSNGDLNLEGHMKVWPGYQPTMKGVCHLWAANLAPSVKKCLDERSCGWRVAIQTLGNLSGKIMRARNDLQDKFCLNRVVVG